MESVKINVTSAEKASRLELFIRFIWGFIVAMILGIIGIFACLAIMAQWFYILIFGKRHAGMAKFVNSWISALCGLWFYNNLSTDERPPLVPNF